MKGADQILEEARSHFTRLTPAEAVAAMAAGGLLVDIRPIHQRAADGEIPGAVVIDRNVLEWRLDPSGDHRIPEVRDYEQPIVILCHEGYASSLAAATLVEMGFRQATDVAGGMVAWLADGQPVGLAR